MRNYTTQELHKEQEPFVDAGAVAAHTGMSRRTITRWGREGHIPAYPVSGTDRHTWRYKLSEVDSALASLGASPIVAVRPGSSAESE